MDFILSYQEHRQFRSTWIFAPESFRSKLIRASIDISFLDLKGALMLVSSNAAVVNNKAEHYPHSDGLAICMSFYNLFEDLKSPYRNEKICDEEFREQVYEQCIVRINDLRLCFLQDLSSKYITKGMARNPIANLAAESSSDSLHWIQVPGSHLCSVK